MFNVRNMCIVSSACGEWTGVLTYPLKMLLEFVFHNSSGKHVIHGIAIWALVHMFQCLC